MKKNDLRTGILIGISAIILPLILMGTATTQSSTSVVPESHVWDAITIKNSASTERVYFFNKVTGEVRSKVGSGKSLAIKTLPLTN